MATAILSATALQRINLLVQQAWTPNQRDIDQNAQDTTTIDTLLARQNSIGKMLVEEITDPNKDKDVRVWWNDFCGQEAEDCASGGGYDASCGNLTGNPSQVDYKDYAVTQCLQKKFKIQQQTFKGSFMSIEQNLLDNSKQAIRQLLNALNKKAIIFLQANAGLNKGGQYPVNGSDQYQIPASVFAQENTRVYTNILYDAAKSRISNPFVLDYGNLWHMNMNAKFDQGNAEGKGNAIRAILFNVIEDIQGGAQVPAAANSTFVVAPYAYAFVNKSYYRKREVLNNIVSFSGSTPVYDEASGKWKWYITIPGYDITVDVLMQRVCVDAKKDIYEWYFQYTLWYDFLLNPSGCDNGSGDAVNGIIEYVKTGASS
ncbi:MAG: hypothetical protein QM802_19920 [Agriterribacter sp.]